MEKKKTKKEEEKKQKKKQAKDAVIDGVLVKEYERKKSPYRTKKSSLFSIVFVYQKKNKCKKVQLCTYIIIT